MTDYTTIRLSKAAKESAQKAKRDGETWNDYLQRCTNTPPSVTEFVPVEDVVGREVPRDQLNQDVMEQLDRIESGVREATNAAQSADKKLEGLGR